MDFYFDKIKNLNMITEKNLLNSKKKNLVLTIKNLFNNRKNLVLKYKWKLLNLNFVNEFINEKENKSKRIFINLMN